jgi:Flp pilus assembly pilin Flp
MLRRFFGDTTGQDLIEYALLAAFIAIVGMVAWNTVAPAISSTYTGWDGAVQNLWEPADPASSSAS